MPTSTDVHACDYHVSEFQSAGCDDRAADSSVEEDFTRLNSRGRRHLNRGLSIEDDEFQVAIVEDFDAPESVHGGREGMGCSGMALGDFEGIVVSQQSSLEMALGERRKNIQRW